MQNIFVYGTLLLNEITTKLTGNSFLSSSAVLNGYKRYSVKGGDYPAIIQQKGSATSGLVIENVDDISYDIITFYEGDEYEKKKVTVFLNDKPTEVWAFVWVKSKVLLENKEWDLNHFQKNSLKHYLNVVIQETLEEFQK